MGMALGLTDETKCLPKRAEAATSDQQQQHQKGSVQSFINSISDVKQKSQDDYCIFSLDEENAAKIEMPVTSESATSSQPQPQASILFHLKNYIIRLI